MPLNYFPIPYLQLEPEGEDLASGDYAIIRRLWTVHDSDLATLAANHKLYGDFGYQFLSLTLNVCTLEFRVSADGFADAIAKTERLRTMLYLYGIHPFSLPFVSTYSANKYAGIALRDRAAALDMPLSEHVMIFPGLATQQEGGITSQTATVEIVPMETTLIIMSSPPLNMVVTPSVFEQSVRDAAEWKNLSKAHPVLETVQLALANSPLIPDVGQSVLHIWTALEALFPNVQTEVTFRLVQLGSNRRVVYNEHEHSQCGSTIAVQEELSLCVALNHLPLFCPMANIVNWQSLFNDIPLHNNSLCAPALS